ncbi:MAG TPA: RHS repeat-associated core domain-containing protein [Chthonomonadaceae bacterium]|nr:RHS repeat-associated core domain-containing protein [Chthonomonadaceae bacterium]
MPTVRYTTIRGEVIAEKRGGVRSLYVPDPLGSTVALLDNTQSQTDTFAYWPYGEVRTRTGTTATPFQFVGTAGYYQDSVSKHYVRSRFLDTAKTRWLTQDLLFNIHNLYDYVSDQPISYIDYSGLSKAGIGKDQCPGQKAYNQLLDYIRKHPNCLKAVMAVCKNGISSEVPSIPITVSPGNPGRGEGSDWQCAGLGDSACRRFPPKDRNDPNEKCKPKDICFTETACMKTDEQKACLLLLEISNWCSCKYLNKFNEDASEKVILACGLEKTCYPLSKQKPK